MPGKKKELSMWLLKVSHENLTCIFSPPHRRAPARSRVEQDQLPNLTRLRGRCCSSGHAYRFGIWTLDGTGDFSRGLSINLSKSKLLGVVVSEDRVVQAANRIGCGVLKAHFAYLGSKVGENMFRIKSWDAIVDKMVDRLSKWKMKTLSIDGRLTLLKAVLGSMALFLSLSIISRKVALGVSSLIYALNRALMLNWVWRITTSKELDIRQGLLKLIHGEECVRNGSGFKTKLAMDLQKLIFGEDYCGHGDLGFETKDNLVLCAGK
ncbi:hypothetical protein Tco_0931019 [Tanacetum coccineum]